MTALILLASVVKDSLTTDWRPVEISVYSARYHGRKTASGERYDHERGYTAATTWGPPGARHRWALPKGSVWEVRYQGRTIEVRVNDCGSHRPRRAPVWLDLSGAAWRDLTGSKPSRRVAQMRRVR